MRFYFFHHQFNLVRTSILTSSLYVSGLTSSASASAVVSSDSVPWCLFHHYRLHGGASVVAETCLTGFSFYLCLVNGSPDGAGSGF
ncbi:hypothetical protein A2U01_0000100 [Trifolium medium]|uniref:Uncharacterized protein n=1 Tax=Trifolium medium TaxID=97028 RepID=A0A392LWL3_9FABA|nr:hypothetical protein [Trifolium medium]